MSSNKIDHGGFAFPTPEIRAPNGSVLSAGQDGMSLLDWYAGKALQGFCANPAVFAANQQNGWELVNYTEEQLALFCHRLAEAMLKARKGEA